MFLLSRAREEFTIFRYRHPDLPWVGLAVPERETTLREELLAKGNPEKLVDEYLEAASIADRFDRGKALSDFLWGKFLPDSTSLAAEKHTSSDSYSTPIGDVDPERAHLLGKRTVPLEPVTVTYPTVRTKTEFVFPADMREENKGPLLPPLSAMHRPPRLTREEQEAVALVEGVGANKNVVGLDVKLSPALKKKVADIRKGDRRVFFDETGKMKEVTQPKQKAR